MQSVIMMSVVMQSVIMARVAAPSASLKAESQVEAKNILKHFFLCSTNKSMTPNTQNELQIVKNEIINCYVKFTIEEFNKIGQLGQVVIIHIH